MSNPDGFGRPQDKDIEKQFMKKIRGDKLQAINAECQLEICLAFHQGKKQKKKPSKRNVSTPQSQANKTDLNEIALLPIGDLGPERPELMDKFNNFKNSWEFQQIQDGQPLPEFFFDDGCDLSYILFNIQKESEDPTKMFKPEELLFLEFLCLEGRGHLNNSILQYYKNNMSYLIDAMKAGLEKIKQKRNSLLQANNPTKFEAHEMMMEEGDEMDLEAEISENEKNEKSEKKQKEKQKNVKKSKPINKKGKGKKGKGKKNKQAEESENEEEEGEMTEENDYPKEKQLAIKTCNYISWAYWYIIKK